MSGDGPAPTGWPDVLSALLAGEDLDDAAAAWAMTQVMAGDATSAQVAGFATALRAKGETAAEVAALARVMLGFAAPLDVPGPVVDTCGTGGDRSGSVNVSTMAAVVVAAAGVRVVKHGNRAASSQCGSADLLEALGVVVDLPPAQVAACAIEVGITFCFAPVFHPAMRHAVVPRRELGVPTVFNVLGPLTNPARPAAQVVGVADARMAPVVAGALAARGASAFVVRGDDGLDELTTTTTTSVWTVRDGDVVTETLDPATLGVPRATGSDLAGGDATHNAAVARRLLDGEPGPVRDAVLLNAAAAVAAVEAGPGDVTTRLQREWPRVEHALDSGAAAGLLARWATRSHVLAEG